MHQRIKAMLEKLLSELPPGAAVLRERRTRRDDGTLFELIPSNHDAAAILVHVEDRFDLVDFSFGESGTWELPVEGRNRNAGIDGILSEVEDMCRAVIAVTANTAKIGFHQSAEYSLMALPVRFATFCNFP